MQLCLWQSLQQSHVRTWFALLCVGGIRVCCNASICGVAKSSWAHSMVLFSLSSLSPAKVLSRPCFAFRGCRKAQCLATLCQLFQNPLEKGTASSQGTCKWESQQADPMYVATTRQKRNSITVCFGYSLLCMKTTIRWLHTIATSEILGHCWRKFLKQAVSERLNSSVHISSMAQ